MAKYKVIRPTTRYFYDYKNSKSWIPQGVHFPNGNTQLITVYSNEIIQGTIKPIKLRTGQTIKAVVYGDSVLAVNANDVTPLTSNAAGDLDLSVNAKASDFRYRNADTDYNAIWCQEHPEDCSGGVPSANTGSTSGSGFDTWFGKGGYLQTILPFINQAQGGAGYTPPAAPPVEDENAIPTWVWVTGGTVALVIVGYVAYRMASKKPATA